MKIVDARTRHLIDRSIRSHLVQVAEIEHLSGRPRPTRLIWIAG